jgi:membrane protein DedA with SNARE-associated domain
MWDLDIAEWVQEWGYLAVFLGALIEGETVILTASALAAVGYLSIFKIAALAFIGTLFADQGLFFVGYWFGEPTLRFIHEKLPKFKPYLEKGFSFLQRYQTTYILIFRFIYGIRIISPVIIGAQRIAIWRFSILNLVAAVIWTVLSCALGYFLGEVIIHIVKKYGYVVLVILVGFLAAGYVLRKLRKKYLSSKETL